ncbi:MAG: sugar phosphate isomerase/epimerase [Clostridia bacterium]|nr:sugar phosphate isomerase/epimerase [Clostridia bacterium]
MKISTEIASAARHVGEKKAVELIARAGFDAWDFSMFNMALYDWGKKVVRDIPHPLRSVEYASFAKELRHIGEECGIFCNQSHAPFPVFSPEVRDCLKRAIECTAIAGGRVCVIHPDNYKSPEQNAEMYFELLPFAREHGVKIATENMWNWNYDKDCAAPAACSHHDDFLAHIQAVNDPYFVACLDIGHAEMKGLDTTAPEMIRTLGDSLQALHIHDNDCWHDSHQIPRSMQIDFDATVAALKEIGYRGEFTLEADQYLRSFTEENLFDGVCGLARAARQLADQFDAM